MARDGIPEHIKSSIRKNDVKTLRLVFCNASGIPCAKSWNSAHLGDLIENGIDIFKGNYFMCLGISPSPNSKFKIDTGDLTLLPDLDTFSILPYLSNTARLYGDLYDKDSGKPWECCARSVLKRTFETLRKEGFLCDTAGELEFYLVGRNQETGSFTKFPLSHEDPPFSTQGLDVASTFINAAIGNLTSTGVDVTRIVKEGGPGQYELNISHSEGVKAGDDILTLREVIKGTAVQNGVYATFMPKPFASELGNGMHLHQSLRDLKSSKNAFVDRSDKKGNGMSDLGYHYIAGLLRHGPALCAVAAPTINSYKRLRPGWVAVDQMKYGKDDRGAAIRIPRTSSKSANATTRIEYRVPDAASNPYLLIACVTAAGLDGIRRNLDPEHFLDTSTKATTKLPKSLEEAIQHFKGDQLFAGLLGNTFFDEYVKLKEFELEVFNQQVSKFELKKYGNFF